MSGGGAPSMLRFRIGSVGAALPLALVREIIERPVVVRVPGTHPQVCGVILRQGVAVPVYDLTRFASLWQEGLDGRSTAAAEQCHLIVCDWGDSLVAILAEQVDLLEPDGIGPAGDAGAHGRLRREFVGGMMRHGDEVVAVLDPVRLFGSLGVPAISGGDALIAKVEELIARTPMVVSDEEAGAMDIISGGDVYRVEHGADRLRTAPQAAAASPSIQPGPVPPPPAPFAAKLDDATFDEPAGAAATHPALAPPDPAAGGAYIGFADVARSEPEAPIIPDRFDESGGASPSTMRLRRDQLAPPADGGPPGPSPAAGAAPDSFTGAFESEFQLSEDDAVAAVAPAEGEGSDAGWTPPPEAPPAETWQSVEPDTGFAFPAVAPAPAAPAPGAEPRSSAAAPPALTPEAIDLIAEKVVQRLSDRIVREIAWEVVPSVAEAVVRRRIREIEEKDPA